MLKSKLTREMAGKVLTSEAERDEAITRAERAEAQLAEANADLVLVQKALATQHEYHKITLDSRDELREQWALAVVRAERAEARIAAIAEALEIRVEDDLVGQIKDIELDYLNMRAERDRLNARIAELERKWGFAQASYDSCCAQHNIMEARAEKAEALLELADLRILDLKNANGMPWKARAELAEAALAIVQSKGQLKEKVALLASENGCLRAELSQTKRDLKDWQDSSEAYRHDAEKAEADCKRAEAEELKAKAHIAALCDAMVYSDSYGVQGSDFQCCHACNAGGAPNVAFKHDERCPVGKAEASAAEWWDDYKAAEEDRISAEAERDALREARWWMSWDSAPKDGRWIVAVCNDMVSLLRVSWGNNREGHLAWCSNTSSYGDGDGLFAGWIDCPTKVFGARAALAPSPAGRNAPRELVSKQAKDEGLWFAPVTITEDYLQRALRALHEAVEGKSSEECARAALAPSPAEREG